MSAYADAHGRLHTATRHNVGGDDFVCRMHALITLLQGQEEVDKEATYHGLEILREMLPSINQAQLYLSRKGVMDDPDFRG